VQLRSRTSPSYRRLKRTKRRFRLARSKLTLLPTAAPCNSVETAVEGSIAGEVGTSQYGIEHGLANFAVIDEKQAIKKLTVLAGEMKPKMVAVGLSTITQEKYELLEAEEEMEVS
jgi:hypothetical protein